MSLQVKIQDALTAIGTEFKTVRTSLSGNNSGDLSGLSTTVKTSLLAAINELKGVIDTLGVGDGDMVAANNLSDVVNAATALANLGGLTQTEVDTRVQLIVDSAPAALDTLNELAAALGDDANFASTVNTALSNRLRFDAVQTLDAGQKTQGQTNLDVYSKAAIGNPETDLAAYFATVL
jgi:hypothetical protein